MIAGARKEKAYAELHTPDPPRLLRGREEGGGRRREEGKEEVGGRREERGRVLIAGGYSWRLLLRGVPQVEGRSALLAAALPRGPPPRIFRR